MKPAVIFFVFFLFALRPLHSQQKKTDIDLDLTDCLADSVNQTTAGMCDCLYLALDQWDGRLNNIYKQLLSKLDSTARKKLVEVQREWIKFKEKEIELIDETYAKRDGTMWLIVRAEKVMNTTKSRALDLQALLDSFTGY